MILDRSREEKKFMVKYIKVGCQHEFDLTRGVSSVPCSFCCYCVYFMFSGFS